ncbi:MAG: CerR family C-terminal domain-containing protein [Pontiellaceae bacterium]|nr:CerR family C-terminal domain-containing protein [Pontiellaceae bacterium]MBN2785654.1 CerR family C-terminal domain-containing protein [Pontiellaceae bacterium]
MATPSKRRNKTCLKLLDAASEIFARKGFRDTTVAEICEAAGANIAAVHYHFGDKETLYEEVWRYAFSISEEAYPIDGGVPDDASVEELLFGYASAVLNRIFSEGPEGRAARLFCQEMAAPTLALERILNEAILPQHQQVEKIVIKVLGSDIPDPLLQLGKHSIAGLCAFFNFSAPLREIVMKRKTLTPFEIEFIAHYVARFSYGGLMAVKDGMGLI